MQCERRCPGTGARSPRRRPRSRAGRARTVRHPLAGPPSDASITTAAASWFQLQPKPTSCVQRGVMEGVDRLFERMVHEHQDRVYAASLAMTGNRHDAEEVAQDTFLRAF